MMSIVIVPVAFMTPTVSSWIFSMMLRDPWDSPMFAIYFSAGAVYSGIALTVLFLFAIRRAYRLEEFITEKHFMNLGYLLLTIAILMLFFTISDVITLGYKMAGSATFYLRDVATGGMSSLFWTYVWGGLIFPIALIALPMTRTVKGVVIAAVAATTGILLEWFFVVMAGSRIPLNPYDPPVYVPNWVEWSATAGAIAIFTLVIVISLKLLPAVSIWEMEAAEEPPSEESAIGVQP
jgi:molybdopterin-containing oxidoreductase family membrane subunit